MTASYEQKGEKGEIALITLSNPPMNGLGFSTRTAIVQGIRQANADPAVQAVVLTGAGKAFSSGADIQEFGTPKATQAPNLLSVIAEIEDAQKPVVAAIHSICMGGGLELALACHYRIAAPGTKCALPEVKLGLIPGAGGTQRLPRVLGVETALNMIVSGNILSCEQLAAVPKQRLFDQLSASSSSLLAEAFSLAREVALRHASEGTPLPRVRDYPLEHSDAKAFFEQAHEATRAKAGPFPAPLKCVEAVQNGLQFGFEEGLRLERELFLKLMLTPECRALRHLFSAERAASKIADVLKGTPQRPIQSVAVIGAGTIGAAITLHFLNAGLPVQLFDDPQLQAADANLADLVVEAVSETLETKQKVFETLDASVKAGAILATSTSTLDINRIAAFTHRPQDVVGLHFIHPMQQGARVLEVVRGQHTAPDVLATVMGLAKKIKTTAVLSGACEGFIGQRMIKPYVRQAVCLHQEGASPSQIDQAIEQFGFAMGPFRTAHSSVAADGKGLDDDAVWQPLLTILRDQPLQEDDIDDTTPPCPLSDEEIVQRLVFALVNEGARLLAEKIAARSSDIDIVHVMGYGFPTFRGGPMHYADQRGLVNVVQAMHRFAQNPKDDALFWQPAPLLAALAAKGESFSAWHAVS